MCSGRKTVEFVVAACSDILNTQITLQRDCRERPPYEKCVGYCDSANPSRRWALEKRKIFFLSILTVDIEDKYKSNRRQWSYHRIDRGHALRWFEGCPNEQVRKRIRAQVVRLLARHSFWRDVTHIRFGVVMNFWGSVEKTTASWNFSFYTATSANLKNLRDK